MEEHFKHSDLGYNEERILMHEDHNIPCDDDEDDDDMEDDELTRKWKLDLSERAQHPSLRKVWRKDSIKLRYSSSLSLKQFSMAKGR